MYNGAAYPCQHSENGIRRCELSPRNSIHRNKAQYGFHAYVPASKKDEALTLAQRVEELERRVSELEEKVDQPDWRQRR